ncbi:MAG: choice-of-anchor Q domain-containing protein [Actinomycetales bacterium]
MFRVLSRRVVTLLALVAAAAGISVAVAPTASAFGAVLYAYAAGGAASPASCPQTTTTSARCSLGQALQLAGGGDTVLLTETEPYVGSFTIASPDTSTAGAVTLAPASGVSQPVLDGAGRGTVLTVRDGVRANISGLSVRNGFAPERDDAPCIQPLVALGGGIYNQGNLSLTDVVVSGNVAADPTGQGLVGIGGGIYNAGVLTVTGGRFDGNTATRSGGAISNGDDRSGCGTATGATSADVTGSRFSGNSADFGGAISTGGSGGDGTLTVTRSTFAGNGRTNAQSSVGGTAGGAIAVAHAGGGLAIISQSTFTDNTAVRGGALSSSESSTTGRLLLADSTFVSNVATARGDAIDQSATTSPGVVYSTTFVNDTIAGGASLRVAASIVSRANGATGASSGCTTPVTDAGYNVSDDASCGFGPAQQSLSNAPIAEHLGALGPHGGPTDTVPISSSAADPANDLIPAAFAPFSGPICSGADQRGVPRGNPCDAGAVESPVLGTVLFAYPTGTGGASGTCPLTTVVTQRCTLTTALALAGAGSIIQLAQTGDPRDPTTWYVGNYLVGVPGTTSDRPLTITPATGVTNPIVDGNLGSSTGCGTARCDRPIFAVATGTYLTLNAFTIQHGRAGTTQFASTFGGSAIAVNFAHVTATGMHFSDNTTYGIATAGSADTSGGDVSLIDSTIDRGTTPTIGVAAASGAVTVARSTIDTRIEARQLTMTRSTTTGGIDAATATISDSTVNNSQVFGLRASTATVTGSTFAGNAGGAFQVFDHLTLAATIVVRAAGGAPDCAGPVSLDAGYNVADDTSCNLAAVGSVQGSSAMAAYLGAFGDHGGPTPTIPLLSTPTVPGSGPDPAARAIPATYTALSETAPHCTLTDQRGVQRTPYCDIGAYELGGTAPQITSADHVTFTSGSSSTFTVTTTGTPTASITGSGSLPTGIKLTDNGDGTATLSGTPTTPGTYPLTITAANRTQPDATQRFTLTVRTGPGFVTASGPDRSGDTRVPASVGTNPSGVTSIAASDDVSLAVASGRVVGWGDNGLGQTTIPAAATSNVTAVAASSFGGVALKRDNSLVSWGLLAPALPASLAGPGGPPITAITGENVFYLALADGSVIELGSPDKGFGISQVPSAAMSGVTAIASGTGHGLALKNGGVVAWGYDNLGQATVPDAVKTGVIAIDAGGYHSLALKSDGTIVAWGGGSSLSTVPAAAQGRAVAIAAGQWFNAALLDDGTIVTWGTDDTTQTIAPRTDGTVTTALAAGARHLLAIRR